MRANANPISHTVAINLAVRFLPFITWCRSGMQIAKYLSTEINMTDPSDALYGMPTDIMQVKQLAYELTGKSRVIFEVT